MRIGELARRAGVSVRSLRYYEEQGLLESERSSSSGQRHYPEAAVDRVILLQRLYAGGLSSRTIGEVLPCVDRPSSDTSEAAFEMMVGERDRLSAHIEDLLRTRDMLDELIATNRRHNATLASDSAR